MSKSEGSIAMQRINTLEVRSYVGERVLVKGWLQSLRQMGGERCKPSLKPRLKSRHWWRARQASKA